MSGLETLREMMRKPAVIVAASGTILVAGMTSLWLASEPQAVTEGRPLQPACIALAIDRDSGTTSTQPCAGTPVLVAGKEPIAK